MIIIYFKTIELNRNIEDCPVKWIQHARDLCCTLQECTTITSALRYRNPASKSATAGLQSEAINIFIYP